MRKLKPTFLLLVFAICSFCAHGQIDSLKNTLTIYKVADSSAFSISQVYERLGRDMKARMNLILPGSITESR
ncbi:MAG: hypothetical protein AAFQ94_28570 [Bacteroidota bacterium]